MKRDMLALLVIASVVIAFFARLFWPEPSIIVTPDFGRSDAWHFSLATKLAAAHYLRRGQLPLWEPRMGMGFPLFAEGQVGALFLPNLLLFRLIDDPVTAYNATYLAIFLILGWGTYWWLRSIGCSRLAGLFGAVTIVFSGQTIPRLPHHTLLQSLTLTPLVLALGHMVITNRGLWLPIFAFTLSQQIFTGSPQPVLLALFLLGLWAISTAPKRIGWLILGVALGVGLAAIQIIPSAEMLRESTSPSGFSPEEASYYSFPLVHLKTIIDAFALGNPKTGTYPPFTTFDGSIFWENNLFIGWLPLVFMVFSFIRRPLAKQEDVLRKFLTASLFFSLLLMLGKYSPLYLLYSVWPLNLFRVPSRFAWIFLFTIITAASRTLSQKVPAAITILLITFQGYQLMTTWWDYQAVVPARNWLASPFVEHTKGFVRTIGSELPHNKLFLKDGWTGNRDQYRFLATVPAPNSNLYWNIRQTDVYAGRFLKRPALVETLLGAEIKLSETVATVSAQGKRLLDLYHANTIVSTLPLDIPQPLPILASSQSGDLTITAYRNPEALPRVYLVAQTVVAPTFAKAAEVIGRQNGTVVVHDEKHSLSGEDTNGTVAITEENATRISMQAKVAAAEAILVFGDTYYPGWRATVDGRTTEIFPVNIKERGIHLTQGNHTVVWEYQPKSVRVGTLITAASFLITLLLLSKRNVI